MLGQDQTKPSLLLIVDVQKSAICSTTAHLPAAVQSLQDHYAKVVATCNLGGAEGAWEYPPLGFTPRADAIITGKIGTSALTPHVREVLDREGITRVDVCGVDTDLAVFSTALALSEIGVRVRVITTACGSTAGEEHHHWGVRFLQRLLGKDALIGFDAVRKVA